VYFAEANHYTTPCKQITTPSANLFCTLWLFQKSKSLKNETISERIYTWRFFLDLHTRPGPEDCAKKAKWSKERNNMISKMWVYVQVAWCNCHEGFPGILLCSRFIDSSPSLSYLMLCLLHPSVSSLYVAYTRRPNLSLCFDTTPHTIYVCLKSPSSLHVGLTIYHCFTFSISLDLLSLSFCFLYHISLIIYMDQKYTKT